MSNARGHHAKIYIDKPYNEELMSTFDSNLEFLEFSD
jgi:hypothetical protein